MARHAGHLFNCLIIRLEAGDVGDDPSDEVDQSGRGDLQLESSHAGADVDSLEIKRGSMEVGRELLLHADRGAAATDVSCNCEEVLHGDHLDLLVARYLCQCLEIDLSVARNHAHYVPGLVSVQHKRLEDALYRLPEAVRYVLRCKVVLVKLIRNELI